ncbi:hypothetical protein PIB30_070565 [Stylosanthes scabra]|uniref:Uncharacterized protein n=1 Tax=Stylosanthes scabra TaxID=79078 RepID=A0ABU6SQ68_9FABA|nr:hypothetical protein [Stylosanthes scabra]
MELDEALGGNGYEECVLGCSMEQWDSEVKKGIFGITFPASANSRLSDVKGTEGTPMP